MRDPKWVLEEVRTHLEMFTHKKERIEEKCLTLELLEEKEFVILLDLFYIEADIPKEEILNKKLTFDR